MKNEKRWNMSTIRNLDISEFSIVEKPETHYLVTVPISHDTPFEQEIELVITETKKYQLRRLHDASYGAILPVENLYCGNLNGFLQRRLEQFTRTLYGNSRLCKGKQSAILRFCI